MSLRKKNHESDAPVTNSSEFNLKTTYRNLLRGQDLYKGRMCLRHSRSLEVLPRIIVVVSLALGDLRPLDLQEYFEFRN